MVGYAFAWVATLLLGLALSVPAAAQETAEGTATVSRGCARVGFDARNDSVAIELVADGVLPTVANTLSLVHPCSGPVTASWSGELFWTAPGLPAALLVEAECTAGGCSVGTVVLAAPNRLSDDLDPIRFNYVLEFSETSGSTGRTASLHVVWPSLPAGTYTFRVRLGQFVGTPRVQDRTLLVYTLGPDSCPPASRCD